MAPFRHRLRVRYHECDPQGVVFFGNHLAYFDTVLTELWRAAFGSYDAMLRAGTDVHVVDVRASYHAPARFDDELDFEMAIVRLGDSSITSRIEERRAGALLVAGRLVHVTVDTGGYAKQAVPGFMREGLAPWLDPAAERELEH
jgi:acyl-CoA thioester hydrolase